MRTLPTGEVLERHHEAHHRVTRNVAAKSVASVCLCLKPAMAQDAHLDPNVPGNPAYHFTIVPKGTEPKAGWGVWRPSVCTPACNPTPRTGR
jgi:hypothetical protein